jgi:ubiquinone/menaquinone biosynthesis C-methylase UbiE
MLAQMDLWKLLLRPDKTLFLSEIAIQSPTSNVKAGMHSDYYVKSYTAHFSELVERYGATHALEMVVGGEYDEIGVLEESALLTLGLRPGHNVVDVGCGTGRLSSRLSKTLRGKFVGTDLVPEFLDYARTRAARPDWDFMIAHAPPLPLPDGFADWVTFFSVFTHILDEDIYIYLREAQRLLKSGGKIVFSFLDYDVPLHWQFFAGAVANQTPNRTLIQFLDRRAVHVWAEHLGLRVEGFYGGEDKWMNRAGVAPQASESDKTAAFGQSVAVLSKP